MRVEKLSPVGLEVPRLLPPEKRELCSHTQNQRLFDFDQLFLVFWRPFAFVGNDAGGRWGDSGIPRRAPRFGALVQDFFLFSFHESTIPQRIPGRNA
jgi:hypothetical protein